MSNAGDRLGGDVYTLLREISESTDYTFEAFRFVFKELQRLGFRSVVSPAYDSHVDATELCWRLHDQALEKFGGTARDHLERWGIQSTSDFGSIMFALIDAQLVAKMEGDLRKDFDGVYNFEAVFLEYHFPRETNRRMQWRLSTLFFITTIAAVAFAGFAKLGFYGAIGTLFSSWLGLIGVFCVFLGVTDRSEDWLLAICMGVLFCGTGIYGFMMVTM